MEDNRPTESSATGDDLETLRRLTLAGARRTFGEKHGRTPTNRTDRREIEQDAARRFRRSIRKARRVARESARVAAEMAYLGGGAA